MVQIERVLEMRALAAGGQSRMVARLSEEDVDETREEDSDSLSDPIVSASLGPRHPHGECDKKDQALNRMAKISLLRRDEDRSTGVNMETRTATASLQIVFWSGLRAD